jgi:hypothetical protein
VCIGYCFSCCSRAIRALCIASDSKLLLSLSCIRIIVCASVYIYTKLPEVVLRDSAAIVMEEGSESVLLGAK